MTVAAGRFMSIPSLMLAVMVTTSVLLDKLPLFTTSEKIYVPPTSALKIGLAVVAPASVVALVLGFELSVHWYVMSPVVVEWLPLPSRVMFSPTSTVRSGPASATGGQAF